MVLSLERWLGKVAVVTGASSGIGAAIVEQLVKNGLIVVGIARRIQLLTEAADRLSGEKGKLHPRQADLSQEEDIVQAFQWIESEFGGVSILVNSAGLAKEGDLINGSAEDWRAVFDLNVLGLSIATREAIRSMQKHQINGHVVHINSYTGHTVPNFPGFNVYPASKFAVTALTETLRQELVRTQSKIKITSVSPGLVATEMTTLKEDLDPSTKQVILSFPILQAEDVADSVIYALSTPEHVQVHELLIKPVGELF